MNNYTYTSAAHRGLVAITLLFSVPVAAACGTLIGAGVGAAGGAIYDIPR